MAGGTSLLPNRSGQVIDVPPVFNESGVASPLARVPSLQEEYDPRKGPPSRDLARHWAAECDGVGIFDMYHSIMLAVEEAHAAGENPRQALEQKIARLRERSCYH